MWTIKTILFVKRYSKKTAEKYGPPSCGHIYYNTTPSYYIEFRIDKRHAIISIEISCLQCRVRIQLNTVFFLSIARFFLFLIDAHVRRSGTTIDVIMSSRNQQARWSAEITNGLRHESVVMIIIHTRTK